MAAAQDVLEKELLESFNHSDDCTQEENGEVVIPQGTLKKLEQISVLMDEHLNKVCMALGMLNVIRNDKLPYDGLLDGDDVVKLMIETGHEGASFSLDALGQFNETLREIGSNAVSNNGQQNIVSRVQFYDDMAEYLGKASGSLVAIMGNDRFTEMESEDLANVLSSIHDMVKKAHSTIDEYWEITK